MFSFIFLIIFFYFYSYIQCVSLLQFISHITYKVNTVHYINSFVCVSSVNNMLHNTLYIYIFTKIKFIFRMYSIHVYNILYIKYIFIHIYIETCIKFLNIYWRCDQNKVSVNCNNIFKYNFWYFFILFK